MTKELELEMLETRRKERRKKKLLKKRIRHILFNIFAVVAVDAAMIFAIIYSIDNMTVYR